MATTGRAEGGALLVDVAALPDATDAHAGATAVVIDVLRMTTTAAVLLAAGVERLLIVADLEAAYALAERSGALLLGERSERPPPGFDGGNSPLEYVGRDLGGKLAVLTTSNGAKAVAATTAADRVLLGAIVNAPAVARAALATSPEEIALVCSGTDGRPSLDDLLGAACIAREIVTLAPQAQLSDMAKTAMALLSAYPDLEAALRDSAHGARLQSRGFGDDVTFAARLGSLNDWAELSGESFVRGG